MPAPPDAGSTAEQLFFRAQATWSARTTPRFESFVLPCASTFLDSRCPPGANVEFIVRLSDGRTYAQTVVPAGEAPRILMRGGYITGPAGAPLGFYRRWPSAGSSQATPPPNLAEDPLPTIATVTAVDLAYRVTLAGYDTIDGVESAHLALTPVRDPLSHPLRDLWIARSNDEIVRLTYALPFKRSTALITYDFAQVGKPPVWSIVHIQASSGTEAISEDVREIAFPPAEPEAYFEPL